MGNIGAFQLELQRIKNSSVQQTSICYKMGIVKSWIQSCCCKQQQIQQKNEQLFKITADYNDLKKSNDALLKQRQRLLNQLNRVSSQNKPSFPDQTDLQKRIVFLESQLRQKDGQIAYLDNELQIKQNAYYGQMQQMQQMQGYQRNQVEWSRQLKEKENELNILKGQLAEAVSKRNNLDRQLISERQKCQQTSRELERVRENNKRQIDNLNKQLSQVNSQLAQIDRLKTIYENQIQALNNEIQALRIEIDAIKQKSQDLNKQNVFLKSQNGRSITPQANLSQRNIKQYFLGDALEDGDDDYREYLLAILQKRLGRKIKRTRLVYRYDVLNKTNVHKYIDGIENLVIIIKLASGLFIAAWTQGGFKPKTASTGDGLILSLTNRRAFEPVKANTKVVSYDDYFIIFGNSQLRLKTQENKIFSNFGVSNGSFKSLGQNVDILFGEGNKREVEVEIYEIFQLQL